MRFEAGDGSFDAGTIARAVVVERERSAAKRAAPFAACGRVRVWRYGEGPGGITAGAFAVVSPGS